MRDLACRSVIVFAVIVGQGCWGPGRAPLADADIETEGDAATSPPAKDGPSLQPDAAAAADLASPPDGPSPSTSADVAVPVDAPPPPPLGACGDLSGPGVTVPLFVPPPTGFVL